MSLETWLLMILMPIKFTWILQTKWPYFIPSKLAHDNFLDIFYMMQIFVISTSSTFQEYFPRNNFWLYHLIPFCHSYKLYKYILLHKRYYISNFIFHNEDIIYHTSRLQVLGNYICLKIRKTYWLIKSNWLWSYRTRKWIALHGSQMIRLT